MKINYPIIIRVIIVLVLITSYLDAATYEKINIIGETSSTGIFDPSIEYTSDGNTGYMAYTACDNWPTYIHTHLAKTTDHGQTWTFVQQINQAVYEENVDMNGTLEKGFWHHETSTLIHDPDDPGKEWKLYWHHHFFRDPYNITNDKLWLFGWIGYKYTSDPEGAWSNEIPLFEGGLFSLPNYPAQIDLNALDPSLTDTILHIEPGGLYLNNMLYLALQSHTGTRAEQKIYLIKSADHGATWSFVSILADVQTATAMGYDFFSAASLVHEAGQTFLFVSPGKEGAGESAHGGTIIVKFEDITNGLLSMNGAGPGWVIYKFLAPTIDTFNAGESEYDAFNYGGGIVFPQLQVTPPIEFQMWNTFEPLLHTPTPVQSSTTTATPNTSLERKILVYPNPGTTQMTFKIGALVGSIINIEIYNLSGELTSKLSQQLNQKQTIDWDCHSVAPGVYIAVIKQDNQELKKVKFSIIR